MFCLDCSDWTSSFVVSPQMSINVLTRLSSSGLLGTCAGETKFFVRSFVIIPVARRVKGYTRFVRKYVTGKRKRFRPRKKYVYF